MESNKIHYTSDYLLNPTHKISVMLIGCGGTGSQVATCLARMNTTLLALDHPGLQVAFVDDDIVTEANIGRQLFSPSDLGRGKASVIAERINRFFNLNWDSHQIKWHPEQELKANIIVSCVDTLSARKDILFRFRGKQSANVSDTAKRYYWLDFGNTDTAGQIILSNNNELKNLFELFPKLKNKEDSINTPSCSIAEAIKKQDLFVNSTLAQLGCNMLWKLFREGKIEYNGLFMNLETLTTKPIKIQ